MIQSQLVVVGGKHAGKAIPLTEGRFLIGREQDCHLRPASESISRHHCVITTDEYAVRIRDLGSTNGTFVNDTAIQGQVMLNSGDLIRVGKLEFEIRLQETAVVHTEAESASAVDDAFHSDSVALTSSETILDMQVYQPGQEQPSPSDTVVASGDTIVPGTNPAVAPEPQQAPAAAAMPQEMLQAAPQAYQQPPGYPPQPYMMPPGYPQQMGYPPYMNQPYPGQPPFGMPGMGMPGMPMPDPSYGQQMHPGMGYPSPDVGYPPPGGPGGPPASTGRAPTSSPPVKLPPPESTGAASPTPPAEGGAAPAQGGGGGKSEEKPSQRAADIIKSYMQRRPGSEKSE